MDTVTHALVGAALSDGCFRRRLGPVATPFSLAVAALPDIDAVSYFISPEIAWVFHRGYTHSLLPIFLAAPAIGYVGYRLSRRAGDWKSWWLLSLFCLLSHTLLDLATSWGTMPLLPFSNARISWDIAPVLDVFMFSVAAGSFVVNRILRRERVDTFLNPLAYPVVHRHPRRQRIGDWAGRAALCLAAIYLCLGWLQNRQTVRIARQELADAGIEAVEVRALPIMFTYVSWSISARDSAGTVYNGLYSSYAPKPIEFAAHPTAAGEDVDAVKATSEGRMFAWYSQGMYVAARGETERGPVVTLRDRRFFPMGSGHPSRFVEEYSRDARGEMRCTRHRQMGFDGVDLRGELYRLWNFTWRGENVADPISW